LFYFGVNEKKFSSEFSLLQFGAILSMNGAWQHIPKRFSTEVFISNFCWPAGKKENNTVMEEGRQPFLERPAYA